MRPRPRVRGGCCFLKICACDTFGVGWAREGERRKKRIFSRLSLPSLSLSSCLVVIVLLILLFLRSMRGHQRPRRRWRRWRRGESGWTSPPLAHTTRRDATRLLLLLLPPRRHACGAVQMSTGCAKTLSTRGHCMHRRSCDSAIMSQPPMLPIKILTATTG